MATRAVHYGIGAREPPIKHTPHARCPYIHLYILYKSVYKYIDIHRGIVFNAREREQSAAGVIIAGRSLSLSHFCAMSSRGAHARLFCRFHTHARGFMVVYKYHVQVRERGRERLVSYATDLFGLIDSTLAATARHFFGRRTRLRPTSSRARGTAIN